MLQEMSKDEHESKLNARANMSFEGIYLFKDVVKEVNLCTYCSVCNK